MFRVTMSAPRMQLVQCAVLLLNVLSSPWPTSAQEPVAVVTPLMYTAYLGQPAVRFHCSAANDRGITWSIDGFIRHSNELEARGIETMTSRMLHESNLTISSVLKNNKTHIQCLARHLVKNHFITSDVAIFYVQGVLRMCPGLQITPLGEYHQHLTWDPPSTLNITAVEPDISSYIMCSNISTECTIINVTEAGGDFKDLRQYTFPNLRAYINFTVRAVNIVGNGESTSIEYKPCEHTVGTSATQYIFTVIIFDSENIPSLSVEVMSQRQCYDVYVVHLEPVEPVADNEGLESKWIIPSVNQNGSVTLNVTTNSTLSTNMFYRATLITAVDMMEAGRFQFSTYDVQQVKLHCGEGNVSIQCVFASGSQARGCYVEIGNSSIQMNITRSGSPLSNSAEQTVTGLTLGNYEVLIFDWERDGSLSPTPSYVGHVNVSETAVFPTSVSPTETTDILNDPIVKMSELDHSTPKGNDESSWHLSPTTVVGIGVGSAAAVLLLAVIVVLIIIAIIAIMAVLKPKTKAVNTGEPHCSATKVEELYYSTVKSEEPHYATVKSEEPHYATVKREGPYYSTVDIKRPDACTIELGRNNAYEIPPQLPQRIEVEENPAYASQF